jgi:hypothetical protein
VARRVALHPVAHTSGCGLWVGAQEQTRGHVMYVMHVQQHAPHVQTRHLDADGAWPRESACAPGAGAGAGAALRRWAAEAGVGCAAVAQSHRRHVAGVSRIAGHRHLHLPHRQTPPIVARALATAEFCQAAAAERCPPTSHAHQMPQPTHRQSSTPASEKSHANDKHPTPCAPPIPAFGLPACVGSGRGGARHSGQLRPLTPTALLSGGA